MCHSLLSGAFPPMTVERGKEKERVTETERERELKRVSDLTCPGAPYTLTFVLYGDKVLEQSLLSIYFLTVKTYIQSESYSLGGMKNT